METLILSAAYEPIERISWERAMTLLIAGRAEIVEEYDHEVAPVTELGENPFRVSARLPIDDLGELFGLKLDDEDVDTVLGLMAKELNKVPIPGSVVQWEGIELTAERGSDRRHTIQTVLASPVADEEDPAAEAAAKLAEESAKRSS